MNAFRIVTAALLAPLLALPAAAEPLTTLDFTVTGQQLQVTPASLAVPKGIPGSFLATVRSGGEEITPANTYVEATLRGPSFPARRIVGPPGTPILLPPLNLVGDYSLDNIRLADSTTDATILTGSPDRVPITVFDEVLIARVTSRPLSTEEIQQRGIVIDENNFRAVEFEVGFVVDGRTIPVKFPVVAPAFYGNTEIIPTAEIQERLAQAELINESLTVGLPPELEASGLEIEVKGLNIQFVDPSGESDLGLSIPPIAGLVVIPGKIGFLNQFFAVQVFVENAAPTASGLSVTDITAELILPTGEDRVPAASYEEPGDDPLRFARVGPEAVIANILPVTRAGADGVFGTADDGLRLQPGQIGQCEFLVEGLREGLHVMDVALKGTLDGLVAGEVEVEGRAAGSILVRNPNFSLAFSHPRTIRTGEPYTASVTILNTSSSRANLVTVTLPEASISGARLTSPATVDLGDILPGQTATAEYRLIAQRTGSITFSNFTSDDDVTGRFRLRMGVDERGVPLNPDSIGYPEFIDDLPTDLFAAADRVLGQALSVATAGQLPPGVEDIPNDGAFVTSRVSGRVLYRLPPRIVQRRIVELAEAGQRLRYGDSLERVLADLLLDWQGARDHHAGFDQILKVTDAGRQWRETIGNLLQSELSGLPAPDRLADRAADLAGRGEAWWAAASGDSGVQAGFVGPDGAILTYGFSELNQSGGYRSADGGLLFLPPQETGHFEWRSTASGGPASLSVLLLAHDGSGTVLTWEGISLPAGGNAAFFPLAGGAILQIDADGDGTYESTSTATSSPVVELAPEVIGAIQDVEVYAGRPRFQRCTPTPVDINGKPHNNYGTIVGVLFSKPMARESVETPAAYVLDDGNHAVSVAIQPGGRVALLNLQRGIGLTQKRDPATGAMSLRQRELTVNDVSDPRGGVLADGGLPILLTADQGTAIEGRVVRSDGSPAANVPVTLTYYEESGIFCSLSKVRPTQVRTDANGRFSLDFVMAGVPYSLSCTDTGGLGEEAIAIILQGSEDDRVVRAKLLDLASQPGVSGTLLEEFAVGGLPAALALVEGLDRALLKDLIEIGSPRTGTETPVALRFRGRATVQGRVLAANGISPVPNAAVNLYPDPASREKGRGMLTGTDGRFEFFGVPLGTFSLQAQAPDGTARALSETLISTGEVREVEVVLSAAMVETTDGNGYVYEADGSTPHGGATVLVGRFRGGTVDLSLEDVVAVVTSDVNGFYNATNIPVGPHDLVAISVDGKRRAIRTDVSFSPGAPTVANLALQARATVRGRVEFADGRPAENAIVAGGLALVRTDAGGNFVLDGVPTGLRAISAGLERNEAAGIRFPRIGSTRINVVPGDSNFVVVRFDPRGSITGRVLTQAGDPVAGLNVALPLDANSFAYAATDEAGVYLFENIGLQEWTVSAPAPAASDSAAIIEGALDTIGDAAAGEEVAHADLLGAITEAYGVFTGISDPLITGEGLTFNPISWGYERVNLTFDGQVANADIIFLPEGTISGTVLNGQDVPIGARVRLTGIGPTRTGELGFIIRGERNSDPATGAFAFPGQALAGAYGLQAANPFFPVVVAHNGATNRVNPNASGIVLQFPPTEETNGRLVGTVFQPDGTPVGEDVLVKISFGDDFVIRTEADGTFDTRIDLPAGGYSVEVEDPVTGLRGQGYVTVQAGIVNEASVILLDKGDLDILVTEADGTPVPNAGITVRKGGFPHETFDLVSGPDGTVLLSNVFEGSYSVQASAIFGPTTIRGSKGATVAAGETTAVTVMLQPTGTIRGTFREDDGATPVPFAQIVIGGGIGFATTDADGRFEVVGLPLGTYRLLATEPVSGRIGVGNASLTFNGQMLEVPILVRSLGEVRGGVLNSSRTGYVPGAVVTLVPSDGLTPQRQVTTGPNGLFSFPGSVEGLFTLSAVDPPTGIRGSVSGRLDPGATLLELDVPLQALGEIAITVFEPDGVTPASATVSLNSGLSADTDATGQVTFGNLPLANYTLTARSITPGRERSARKLSFTISQAGPNAPLSLSLLGVGTVNGLVVASDGTTPANNATITLQSNSNALPTETRNFVTGPDGSFIFAGVSVGSYQLTATSVALAASTSASIDADGEVDELTLMLGDNGSVRGRLLRADGITPVTGLEVGVFFESQSGLLGVKTDVTAPDGSFEMSGIPVGPFDFEALLPSVNGIARLSSALTGNGELLDLGNVLLDEDDLRVESVLPADGTLDTSVIADVLITFNEAVDPGSFDANGIYLCNEVGTVEASLSVEDDGSGVFRVVRLHPNAPLESETTYHLVVLDGDRLGAGSGGIAARGPRDLVGRPLVVPFQSSFATEDARPPELLSLTPADGAIQVDVRNVVRLSFDEPIDPSGILVMLNGPAGLVAGSTALGVNSQVAVFTPGSDLAPNSTYTIIASGFKDLAGNVAEGQPYGATFSTLDTVGPSIAEIRLKDGALPVGKATVELEAVLATPEPGARVRMTADFVPIGETTTPGDLDLPFTLPETGSVTIRAIAIDQFGNEGPFAQTIITVLSNRPPEITATQISPAAGPITTGSPFQIRVEATDDSGVVSFRAAVTGGAEIPLRTNADGSPIFLSGTVSAAAGPSSPVTVLAQATDSSGESTPELSFEFPVADGTPPAVAFLAPDAGTDAEPGESLPLDLQIMDNFGVTEFDLVVSGAFSSSETIPTSGIPDETVRIDLAIPEGLPLDGTPFLVQITARDAAANSATTSRSFQIPDRIPPSQTFVSPANGSTENHVFDITHPELRGVYAVGLYDEEIAEESLVPGSITMTDSTGTPVAGTIVRRGFGGNFRHATFLPDAPLPFGETFTVTFTSLLTDLAGNGAVPRTTSFSTKSLDVVQPLADQPVVEGQAVPFRAVASSNPNGPTVEFFGPAGTVLASAPLNTAGGISYETSVTIPMLDVLGPAPHVFGAAIRFNRSGGGLHPPHPFATIPLDIRPRDEDSDDDGISNGDEIDNGLDPFTDDASEDPDGDTLTNAEEVALGTDPLNPDTDGDGLRDDLDPDPLTPLGGAAPVAGTPLGRGSFLHFDGVNDRIQPSFQLNSSGLGSAVTVEGWIRTAQEVSPGSLATVMAKWNGTLAERYAYGVFIDENGALRYQAAGSNQPSITLTSRTPLNDGEWHHFACVREGTAVIRIFVDGIEDAILEDFGLNLDFDLANASALFFGTLNGSQFYEGDLDEIRIWNRVRSQDEIRRDARRRLTGLEPGLNSYFHFDEGGGEMIFDHTNSAGNAALGNGTVSQRPAWEADDKTFYGAPTVSALQETATVITLPGFDPDGAPMTAVITSLPENGRLFQTTDGSTPGAPVSSAFGASLRWDGIDDFVQVGSAPALEFSDNFTIEAWIQPSSDQNGIIVNREGEYEIARFPDGTIQWAFANTDPGWTWHSTGLVAPLHQWTHVAVSYAGGTVRTYGNGTLAHTYNGSGTIGDQHPAENDFRIGGRQLGAQFFHGALDEIRVWNTVLDEAQIAARFERSLDGSEPGLVALYRFDEGTGTDTEDSSPNTLTATLGGGMAGASPTWQSSGAFPRGGVAVTDPQRRVIYEPAADFSGRDLFGYRLLDPAERSALVDLNINVRALNTPASASPDTPLAYQDVETVIDVLRNDHDPESDTLRVASFTQPANGLVTRNDDGTLSYTPPPGFTGPESFTYIVADMEAWNRTEDYQEGSVNFSIEGNPTADAYGFPVWQADVQGYGDPLTGPSPWYRNSGGKAMWNQNWRDGAFVTSIWAGYGNGYPRFFSTATEAFPGRINDGLPVMRWICPFDDYEIDLLGTLGLSWSGIVFTTGTEIDVAVALHDTSEGTITELFTRTVPKPTADNSIESTRIPIELRGLTLDQGDTLIFAHRHHNNIAGALYLGIEDLWILPVNPANATTVTFDVRANARPEIAGAALVPKPALYLPFDGDVLDAGENHLDGTLNGNAGFSNTVPEALGSGQSLSLDGSSDYVFVPANPVLDGSPFTLAYWVNQNGNAQNGGFERVTSRAGDTFETAIGTDGGVSSYPPWTASGVSVPANGWSHLTWVHNADTLRLYVDGTLQGSSSRGISPSGTFTIGARTGGSEGFAGLLDDLAYWNSALPEEEIALLANTKLGGLLHASTLETPEDTEITITLSGEDGDDDPLTAEIASLPAHGTLYQTADGVTRGSQILGNGGNALEFDGVDDVVFLPSGIIDGATDLTVQWWAKPASGSFTFFSGARAGQFNGFLIPLRNAGTTMELWEKDAMVASWTIPNVVDGQWHSFTLVRNQSAGRAELFVDAVSMGTTSSLLTAIDVDMGGFVLGQEQDSLGGGFDPSDALDGAIDEIRFWDRSLTAVEIVTMRNAFLTGTESGLRALYRLDEGTGTEMPDSGPNGFDAILGDGTAGTDPERIPSEITAGREFRIPVTDPQRRVIYVPDTDFNGFDQLEYVVSDGKVDSLPGSIAIETIPVNDAPIAVDDFGGVTVTDVPMVTQNTLANDIDPDEDLFEVASSDAFSAEGGMVEYAGSGRFHYIPPSGFSGEDSFSYTLTDGMAEGPPATVTITVAPLNTFTWNNPAGGNWGDAGNWTPNGVPGAGDLALIELSGDYTVTVNLDTTISALEMGAPGGTQTLLLNGRTLNVVNQALFGPTAHYRQSSGNLAGIGNVFFDGTTTWTGGNMSDSGRKVNRGTFTATPTGQNVHLVNNCAFENEGTVLFNSATNEFYAYTGATILNAPGALWDIQTDRDQLHFNGTRAVFTNQGEFRKSSVAGSTLCQWTFHNAGGSVDLQAGEIEFEGGGSSTDGDFAISAGAALRFDAGTFNLDADSQLSGAGRFEVRGAAVNFSASSTVTGAFQISGGTFAVHSELVMPAAFTFSSGDLAGTGNVFFDGATTWTGGYMRDAGRKVNRGTFTATPTGQNVHLVNNCAFENEGTVLFNSATNEFYAFGGATILNSPGALWDIQTDRDQLHFNGTRAVFTNQGEFRKSAVGGSTLCHWAFHNAGGSVDLQAGEIEFEGGGSATDGDFAISAGAALRFDAGTFNLDADSQLSGAGRFEVRGATVNFSASSTFTGDFQISGGTFAVHSELVMPAAFTFSSGDLAGTGNVFFDGATTWTGGYMRDPGRKVNRGTLTATPTGQNVHLVNNCAFENEGTVLFNSATNEFYAFGGATILNSPGALWDIQTDRDQLHFNGTRAVFTNQGEFRKSAVGGSTLCHWAFHNAGGSVDLQAGEIEFEGGGSATDGDFAISAGAALRFDAGTFNLDADSQLSGAGRFEVRGAAVNFSASSTVTGAFQISGGTFAVHSELVMPAAFTFSSGDLAGTGNVFFDGATTWTGGYMRDPGRKVNRGTLTATPTGQNVHLVNNCAFENEGTVLFNSATNEFYAFGGATILNSPGALWNIQTERDHPHFNGTRATFTNQGELRKNSAGSTYFDWNFTNSGIINIQSGELDFRQAFTQNDPAAAVFLTGGNFRKTGTLTLGGGVFNGSGTIAGSVANNGATIQPGGNLGNLAITGNYTQGAEGTLEMEIVGTMASGNFDTLTVGGTATLAGTYQLVVGAFVGTPGEVYETIAYASRTGSTTFDNVLGVTNQNGIDYLAMYLPDKFTLSTAAAAPAPALAERPEAILPGGESGFAKWIEEAFGPGHLDDDSTICGDLADPDGDGLCNLLEYAFGGNPLEASPMSIRPKGHLDQIGEHAYLCLTYYRRKNADLAYRVEGSTDLQSWQTGTEWVEELYVEELVPPSPHFEQVTVRWTAPTLTNTAPGFLRVRVERILPIAPVPLDLLHQSDSDTLAISFPTEAGRTYLLQGSPDASTWTLHPDVPETTGTGEVLTLLLPRPADEHYFFRLLIR